MIDHSVRFSDMMIDMIIIIDEEQQQAGSHFYQANIYTVMFNNTKYIFIDLHSYSSFAVSQNVEYDV